MAHTCGRCDLEIRLGWREGPLSRPDQIPFWMHQDPADDADHRPIFGKVADEAYWARIAEGRNALWTTTVVKNKVEVELTTSLNEWESKKYGVDDDGEEVETVEAIPDPEIWALPVEKLDADHVPGGAKTIWNLAEKNGWTITSATYSRGPRCHATLGTLLGISDYLVLKMALDGSDARAVASWCDGKFAWAYTLMADLENQKYINHGKTNSDGLKAWIKGEDS